MAATTAPRPNCIRCNHESFAIVQVEVGFNVQPLSAVACRNCGGVVSTTERLDVSKALLQQNEMLNSLALKLGLVDRLTTTG